MQPAHQTDPRSTARRGDGLDRGIRNDAESRRYAIEEPPALVVLLAPVIGLLMWIGLFMLIF